MNHEKLTATHKRLTLIFTWVVFCIVLVLWLSVLGAKYYNELRIAKRDFIRTTWAITNIIETDRTFPSWFIREQVREKRGRFRDIRSELGESPLLSTSFFIVNWEGEVVFQNILEKPNFSELRPNIWSQSYLDENTIIRRVGLTNSALGQEVIFFKKLRYGTNQLFEELLFLLWITILFSVLFHFIGYRFVERALKPVEENLRDMWDFIHNAGHELKTPLAVMRGNLQVMQVEEKLDPKLLKSSIRELDNMNELIEWLRELSEVWKLQKKEHIALATEVSRVVKDLKIFAKQRHVAINNTVKGVLTLHTHRQELDILLSNLIKNGIKYNRKWWEVDISMKKNILSIRDTGKWISPEEQTQIFERFYQWETARSSEWSGIWLSLVKKIADANGWKIWVTSEEWKWSTFQVTF